MIEDELPAPITESLTQHLNITVHRATALGGGMINQAAKVDTDEGTIFVKWNPLAPPDLFTTEAEGLRALATTETLHAPKVLYASSEPAYLALEYIAEERASDSAEVSRKLGEQLALLHKYSPQIEPQFGFDHDNYIGSLPQKNEWCEDWPTFYRDQRLLPQIEIARDRKRLSRQRENQLQKVVERAKVLLQDLDSAPSLLHGDLWGGNTYTNHDEPVVIDPAAYYGEREMEIAYCELFGGFTHDFYEAYKSTFPLQDGYEKRKPLHQLYHLLSHLNHFGESYGGRVDSVCVELLL